MFISSFQGSHWLPMMSINLHNKLTVLSYSNCMCIHILHMNTLQFIHKAVFYLKFKMAQPKLHPSEVALCSAQFPKSFSFQHRHEILPKWLKSRGKNCLASQRWEVAVIYRKP